MFNDDDLRAALATRVASFDADVEAELGRVLHRVDSRARARRTSYAVGLVAAVLATMLVIRHDWQVQGRGPEPSRQHLVHATALGSGGRYSDPSQIAPGRYRASFLGAEWDSDVRVELDVPSGWAHDDRFALATGEGEADTTSRIDLFTGVRRIRLDPCSPRLVITGDGALTLAESLTTLARTRATGPTPTTLDGYRGYRVLLMPSGTARAGPRCAETSTLREGSEPGTIWARPLAGWTTQIWVLDVAQYTVVISASYGPEVSAQEIGEVVRIVQSASFVLS